MTNNCLNCNKETTGNFCSNCSQATSTHKFSLKHLFQHDFIHGIFHFDKGFFYTIKELFTRPGHSIRDYIQGKRTKHFNYFATIILLMTIGYFLKKWVKFDATVLFKDKKEIEGLLKVLKDYSKIIVFIHIPIISIASCWLFKKSKQNYAENLVLNLYLLCGALVISFTTLFCMIFTDKKDAFILANNIGVILTLIYVIIFYYQYFSVFYSKKYQLIIRVIIIAILYLATKQLTNDILNTISLKFFN